LIFDLYLARYQKIGRHRNGSETGVGHGGLTIEESSNHL